MSLTLMLLFSAMAAATMAFAPRPATRRIRVDDANAPPPPRDPRGERFLL
jgi:hypothetical protein